MQYYLADDSGRISGWQLIAEVEEFELIENLSAADNDVLYSLISWSYYNLDSTGRICHQCGRNAAESESLEGATEVT